MPNEMIERVAKALFSFEGDGSKFSEVSATQRDYWLGAARAAIEALREPTDQQSSHFYLMKRAEGYPEGDATFSYADWERGIDAALKE